MPLPAADQTLESMTNGYGCTGQMQLRILRGIRECRESAAVREKVAVREGTWLACKNSVWPPALEELL
jgi:hypothetical protein